MMKVLRWSAIVLGGVLLVLGVTGFGLYRAATVLPEEYQTALEANPEQLERQRQELESQIAALYSDVQRPAEQQQPLTWEATVTDSQINGWLATRLDEEFPEAAELGVVSPRVLFTDEGLMLAFRVKKPRLDAVVTFHVIPFVAEDGRLGIELTDAKLGAVPMPTGRFVELSRPMLAKSNLPIEWSGVDDRPALLVEFEPLASDSRHRRTLTAIEYAEGRLSVAGKTERREPRVARTKESMESPE